MDDATLVCPHCGSEIQLTEALGARIRAQIDAEHETHVKQAIAEAEARLQAAQAQQRTALEQQLELSCAKAQEAEAREIAQRQKLLELEQSRSQAIAKARLEVEERLQRETESKAAEAARQAKEEAALELQRLQARLADEQRKREESQRAELALRAKADELEARAREIDLELARRMDQKKAEWEANLRQSFAMEQELKLREKEKQIGDMKRVIDDLKRKSEQGSQEMQGEVLELDIQAALECQFPHDVIRPVPKGMTGADLIQEVRDGSLNACGSLIWEIKNTKHWAPAWIDKLKDDQRTAGAALAIIVTAALPDGVRGFAQINGVWISDLAHYPALAVALRDQLQQVAFARAASQGKNEKMETLYRYLAGDEFRHRVEAIVEAFTAMRDQLEKERRTMQKHWAEREKQIERVIASTTGMYGSLQGIIGQGLTPIAALEFDADEMPLLDEIG